MVLEIVQPDGTFLPSAVTFIPNHRSHRSLPLPSNAKSNIWLSNLCNLMAHFYHLRSLSSPLTVRTARYPYLPSL